MGTWAEWKRDMAGLTAGEVSFVGLFGLFIFVIMAL
jgi:hypothetical protein